MNLKSKCKFFYGLPHLMVRVPMAQPDCCWVRQNLATYIQIWNHMVGVLAAQSEHYWGRQNGYRSRRSVRLLLREVKLSCVYLIQTSWSEFQKFKSTVASKSIPLLLHVFLESTIHSSVLLCSVVVWLGFWNSEHDETWMWAMGQWDRPPLLGHYCCIDEKTWILK